MRKVFFCRECKDWCIDEENNPPHCSMCNPRRLMVDSGVTENEWDELSSEEQQKQMREWFGNSAKAQLIAIMNNPGKQIYQSRETSFLEDLISEDETGLELPLDGSVNFEKIMDNSLLLGKCGELYVQTILENWGYKVYTPLVDDHGIDLLARDAKETVKLIKVQVKTVKEGNYTFIRENVFLNDDNFFVFYVRVDKFGKPSVFLYPSKLWPEKNNEEITKSDDGHFTFHPYSGQNQVSQPEYGISGSAKYYQTDNPYKLNAKTQWLFEKPEILK